MTSLPAGRARARELGLGPGVLPPGPLNAITDVTGVGVGHATIIEGSDVRTGVTAIVHEGLSGSGHLPAGLSVFNGFGKMVGSTQIDELGQIETPVLLTSTLATFAVADALVWHMLGRPGNESLRTINPVVAETNDGYLSDPRRRPITAAHVEAALALAASGPVAEGCVGAGTGTGALGFKAGIGTSSRRPEVGDREVTVGVLVQANFSGTLTVLGTAVPAGNDSSPARRAGQPASESSAPDPPGNSCVIVLATEAALDSRQLQRLARRAFAGMARAGSDFSGHSGDYALAFATAPASRAARPVPDQDLDPMFAAAIEATEEAILNSLFAAVTMTGFQGHVREAVPLEAVRALGTGGHDRRG